MRVVSGIKKLESEWDYKEVRGLGLNKEDGAEQGRRQRWNEGGEAEK